MYIFRMKRVIRMIQKRMKLITQQMRRAGKRRALMITVRRRVTGPERKMNRVNIENYCSASQE